MKKTEQSLRRMIWMLLTVAGWIAAAVLITMQFLQVEGAPDRSACILSCLYVGILLVVMAIGNFLRLHSVLALVICYAAGVMVRAIVGFLTALLILEPTFVTQAWFHGLDMLAKPLWGFEYAAAQLTSHFVTEIYWLGLTFGSMMFVFLASAAVMAVNSRQQREREQQRRRRSLAAQQRAKEKLIAKNRPR